MELKTFLWENLPLIYKVGDRQTNQVTIDGRARGQLERVCMVLSNEIEEFETEILRLKFLHNIGSMPIEYVNHFLRYYGLYYETSWMTDEWRRVMLRHAPLMHRYKGRASIFLLWLILVCRHINFFVEDVEYPEESEELAKANIFMYRLWERVAYTDVYNQKMFDDEDYMVYSWVQLGYPANSDPLYYTPDFDTEDGDYADLSDIIGPLWGGVAEKRIGLRPDYFVWSLSWISSLDMNYEQYDELIDFLAVYYKDWLPLGLRGMMKNFNTVSEYFQYFIRYV